MGTKKRCFLGLRERFGLLARWVLGEEEGGRVGWWVGGDENRAMDILLAVLETEVQKKLRMDYPQP